MDDEVILTLHCRDCECEDCKMHPNGKLLINREGCTRRVSEETKDKFFHYMQEVLPFVRTYKNRPRAKEKIDEIEHFLFSEVYSAPLGQKLNKDGRGVKFN